MKSLCRGRGGAACLQPFAQVVTWRDDQPMEERRAVGRPFRAVYDDASRSVLARGLRLLDAFGSGDTTLTLTELAERTGLPKPTAYRLLSQLVAWGGLERDGCAYRIGMKLFVLGQRVPLQRRLRDAALPYLEDLYEATHENIHLSVLDG